MQPEVTEQQSVLPVWRQEPRIQQEDVFKRLESDVHNTDTVYTVPDTLEYSKPELESNGIFYVRKTNFSHLEIQVDESVGREELSPFAKILLIIRRLGSRFTAAEEYLITVKYKYPLDFF